MTRTRTATKDKSTLLYILAFITLAVFTYGMEQDLEFKQASLYVDYN